MQYKDTIFISIISCFNKNFHFYIKGKRRR